MSILYTPNWIKPHLYSQKKFCDLSNEDIEHLRLRISKFKHDEPDITIVIPAWNEGNNIFRTLSSLAFSKTKYKVEIIVINNNSTDNTQHVLDRLGVLNYFQAIQGIAHARQMGLSKAKGKYHLCADSDTYYPPNWIDLMVAPMVKNPNIVGVYGRYSFVPRAGKTRAVLWLYEKITGALIRLRKKKHEYINVLGFNMGFITEKGKANGGFQVSQNRKYNNSFGSENYIDESEDGRMAQNLKKTGQLKFITHPKARVFTSPRRLEAEGGVLQSFTKKIKIHSNKFFDYVIGK